MKTIEQEYAKRRALSEHWLLDSELPLPFYPQQGGLPRTRSIKIIVTRGCWAGCDFCGFSQPVLLTRKRPPAPVIAISAALLGIRQAPAADLVKLVTGLSFAEPTIYFSKLIEAIRRQSNLPIQAFSAVEVDHLSRRDNRPARQILSEWRSAGMDRLGPGGSELLVDRERQSVAPYRPSVGRWLEIQAVAQQVGLKTTLGLMVDRHTSADHMLEHLDRIRPLASELAQIEVQPFEPEGSRLTMLAAPRFDQILRTVKAIRSLYGDVPLFLNQRTVASADAEVLLAHAGLSGLLHTIAEVEPSTTPP